MIYFKPRAETLFSTTLYSILTLNRIYTSNICERTFSNVFCLLFFMCIRLLTKKVTLTTVLLTPTKFCCLVVQSVVDQTSLSTISIERGNFKLFYILVRTSYLTYLIPPSHSKRLKYHKGSFLMCLRSKKKR